MSDKIKKKNRLSSIDKLKNESEKHLNGWKRALADYENLEKSSSIRLQNTISNKIADIFLGILPTINLYQSAIDHAPEEIKASEWFKGLIQIHSQWIELFKQYDVEEIRGEGDLFNPELHEAIEVVTMTEEDDQVIVTVKSPGYKINDKIITPAKVVVNNKNK